MEGFAGGIYTPPLASGITAITNKACSSTQRQSLPQGISLQLKVAHAKMGSGRKRGGGKEGEREGGKEKRVRVRERGRRAERFSDRNEIIEEARVWPGLGAEQKEDKKRKGAEDYDFLGMWTLWSPSATMARQHHTCILQQWENIHCNPLFFFNSHPLSLFWRCRHACNNSQRLLSFSPPGSPLTPPSLPAYKADRARPGSVGRAWGKVTSIRPAQLCHSNWKGQVCSHSLLYTWPQKHCGP